MIRIEGKVNKGRGGKNSWKIKNIIFLRLVFFLSSGVE